LRLRRFSPQSPREVKQIIQTHRAVGERSNLSVFGGCSLRAIHAAEIGDRAIESQSFLRHVLQFGVGKQIIGAMTAVKIEANEILQLITPPVKAGPPPCTSTGRIDKSPNRK
jgi:hypothetical protein